VPSLFQTKAFLRYWLLCVDEHSLHSPFFFDFYTKVLKAPVEPLVIAEKLRSQLQQSNLTVRVDELGSGSVLKNRDRKVRDMARVSMSSMKFSSLYAAAIRYFNCRQVLELGTSLGINTLYLAKNPAVNVATFEGVPGICEMARDTFNFAQAGNIQLIEGNIDETLEQYLRTSPKPDFVFIDANHRYEAVMNYFRKFLMVAKSSTVIVLDDIHLSPDMEKSWQELQQHELVYASADLFRCGFIFVDPSLGRQHRVLQF
jgi:predicted O-methyltransferase YrrM